MRAGIMTLGDAFAECLRYLCGLGAGPIRHHHREATKLQQLPPEIVQRIRDGI